MLHELHSNGEETSAVLWRGLHGLDGLFESSLFESFKEGAGGNTDACYQTVDTFVMRALLENC